MSTVISNENLKRIVSEGEIIKKGSVENCKGMKYDFTLSDRFLKAKSGQPLDYDKLSVDDKKKYAVIKPGEVVYVLAKETVSMPKDIYAQLTPKRNMGEIGINVHCALFIDPEYEGVLVFGLYNYSSMDFHFTPGRTFASAVFYKLEDGETFEYNQGKSPKAIWDFSPELINTISKYEPIGFQNLSDRVHSVENTVKSLEDRLNDNDQWVKEVKKVLDQTSEQCRTTTENIEKQRKSSKEQFDKLFESIKELQRSLETETGNRKAEDTKISNDIDAAKNVINDKISKVNHSSNFLGGIIGVLLFIIGSGVTFLISLITGLIKFS